MRKDLPATCKGIFCSIHSPTKKRQPSSTSPRKRNIPSTSDRDRRADEYKANLETFRLQQKQFAVDSRRRVLCLQQSSSPERCPTATRPTDPGLPPGTLPDALRVSLISDEDAAYIAFARLRLNPPTPVITPSPEKNKWKMAAVGYPLWLSVSGDTNPPGVSDAVANVRVSLKARVNNVTFAMGDGHSVNCTNVTTRWNSSIKPGKPSPVCGYVYKKPSLPKGEYTVTAITHWSVAWSTSRQSGVIDFIQTDSSQVPVGELQVLVR